MTIDTFEKAVDYLLEVPRFTGKNTPEDTRNFLAGMGHPDKKLNIIHVAGTNGKGSVCAYLRCILEQAGKRVAVFTSPHLVDIRERFVMNGKMVEKEKFLEAFHAVYGMLDHEAVRQGRGYHPTFFEYLFFMAMYLFAEEAYDYCILETGLGGRLDATNAVSGKALAVITRIGLDHVEYLGNTIHEIAGEKAGIMMAGAPVIFADVEPEATRVFRKRAAELGILAFPVSKNDYAFSKFHNKSIDFSVQSQYYGYIRLMLHTIAPYQMENAALAVRAVELLDGGRSVTADMLRAGLECCCWPGRMEEILPEVFLDGAHNADGIRAFLDTVRADRHQGNRSLLFGVVRDKDYGEMLGRIISSGLFSGIMITRLQTGRSVSAEEIEEILRKYPGCACDVFEDSGTAFHELLARRGDGERIYIAGSLYLAGEIKEFLAHDQF